MQKRILVVRTSLLVKDKTKILFYTALTAVPEQPEVANEHCVYNKNTSGVDAFRGNTRSHPEHDG